MAEDADHSQHNICPKCHHKVFFNERAPPFLSHTYHARCFQCTGCAKILYAGNFVDHEDKAYCCSCYDRLFAGNRKLYAKPHSKPLGDIDTEDPLKNMRSATKKGKINIKRFTEKLNIPEILNKSHTKAAKRNNKLHQYMLGPSHCTDSLMMDGRMKFIYTNLQNRLHKMVTHQCYTLQQKLIERVDHILLQEVLEFDHNHLVGQRHKLFDRELIKKEKKSAFKKNKELHQIQQMLETPLEISDFPTKKRMRGKENKDSMNTTDNTEDYDGSDLDTQELISRLANNQLLH